MAPVHIALSILAIAAAVVAVTALAERIRFSAPLLLMLVGIGASFVKHLVAVGGRASMPALWTCGPCGRIAGIC